MKKLLNKWNKLSLILRIFIGLVIGVFLGVVAPKALPGQKLWSSSYILLGANDIFGGFYFNNGINETSDDELTCIQGGAIYNFGTLKLYGGTFNANRSVHGGAFFN